jgi:hypothetical protein
MNNFIFLEWFENQLSKLWKILAWLC